MKKYKIFLGDQDLDEIYDTYEEAAEGVLYHESCCELGEEMLELSNPGDYSDDFDDEPEYEIVEIDV